MSWEMLPTDYTDAVWAGLKKYSQVDNDDGTVSFLDVTSYSNKEKSFFGALDANRMNEAMNIIMSMLENGTDLYTLFQEYFETQKGAFSETAAEELENFLDYLTSLKSDAAADIQEFTERQQEIFLIWFQGVRDKLAGDVAAKLSSDVEMLKLDKQDKITGAAGQIVGFDEDGNPVAQQAPDTGVGISMAGQTVVPIWGESVVAGEGAEIFNDYRKRVYLSNGSFINSGNIASGECSHAEGKCTTASGDYAHAEGSRNIASNFNSHAEGANTEASGMYSHAEGWATKALGQASHAQNSSTIAAGADQTAMGSYNIESPDNRNRLIIGKGTYASGRSNCFRVTDTGVYASGAHNSSGADYAEMFEWADGNPERQDRAGRFVTLDGAKIRLAGPEDDYIIGIVSGNPSVVGDVHDDQWQGMYLYDIFGRPLWEDVDMPDMTDADGWVMISAHTEHRQKINPDYDNSQAYQPRSKRPEWDAVGMLGKLVAVDDGSCVVNGWCAVGEGGIAVRSDGRTRYRVMERLDENHIRVLIL